MIAAKHELDQAERVLFSHGLEQAEDAVAVVVALLVGLLVALALIAVGRLVGAGAALIVLVTLVIMLVVFVCISSGLYIGYQ